MRWKARPAPGVVLPAVAHANTHTHNHPPTHIHTHTHTLTHTGLQIRRNTSATALWDALLSFFASDLFSHRTNLLVYVRNSPRHGRPRSEQGWLLLPWSPRLEEKRRPYIPSSSLPPPTRPTILTMRMCTPGQTGHVQDTVTNGLRKASWEEQHFVKIRKKIIELRTKRKDFFLSKRSSQGHVTL